MLKELLGFLQFADHPMAAGVGNKFLGPLLEIVMHQPIALRKGFRKVTAKIALVTFAAH